MFEKFIECLSVEKDVIEKLVKLAKTQQQCLIKFDISQLNEITPNQDYLQKQLKSYEEYRVKLLMKWLEINSNDALSLKLTTLEKKLNKKDMALLRPIRIELQKLVLELQNLTNTNRVLVNRAKNSVQNIMNLFTRNGNQIVNKKI
ncbi:MAG: flagellar protein FlgN [Candidatus Kapaibacteriota bacterium]